MQKQKERIVFDPCDFNGMVKIMDEYGDHEDMMFGQNEEGDFTTISVCADSITIETLQCNGWIRTNVYWRDGTVEELYSR